MKRDTPSIFFLYTVFKQWCLLQGFSIGFLSALGYLHLQYVCVKCQLAFFSIFQTQMQPRGLKSCFNNLKKYIWYLFLCIINISFDRYVLPYLLCLQV